MSVTFAIPAPYRKATDGHPEVAVPAETVGEAIQALNHQYPDMGRRLVNAQGALDPYVNVYLNGERLSGAEALERKVRDGDRLVVMPVIGGGQ